MKRIGVINYGVGNLRSVGNAIRHLGHAPLISSDPMELLGCHAIIFPGVGAFGYGIKNLRETGLDQVIAEAAHREMPVLGICLGMQLLHERSGEFGDHEGLGIIKGCVEKFGESEATETELRLPNVGWFPIEAKNESPVANTLLNGIQPDARFYFVHSFFAANQSPSTLAISRFGNQEFCAITVCGSVIGTQFHPEKSGPNGLRLLDNFINQRECA